MSSRDRSCSYLRTAEAAEALEPLRYNVAARCFRSGVFATKLAGFKMLLAGCGALVRGGGAAGAPPPRVCGREWLLSFIRSNGILPAVFSPHGEKELIQRSGDLLRLLVGNDAVRPLSTALAVSDVGLVWSVHEGKNLDTIVALTGVLVEVVPSMSLEQMSALTDCILAVPRPDVVEPSVGLLAAIARVPRAPSPRVLDALWAMAAEESGCAAARYGYAFAVAAPHSSCANPCVT